MKVLRLAATTLLVLVPLGVSAANAEVEDAGPVLHDLFAREWQTRLDESPRMATS